MKPLICIILVASHFVSLCWGFQRHSFSLSTSKHEISILSVRPPRSLLLRAIQSPRRTIQYNTYDPTQGSTSTSPYTISRCSLNTVSQMYKFSLDFLGDVLAQVGVSTPIDPNEKIGSIMSGHQMFKLLQSINSLDPVSAGEDYNVHISAVADQFGLTPKDVKFICDKEGIKLPFGMKSCLHDTVTNQFIEALESGDYAGKINQVQYETDFLEEEEEEVDDEISVPFHVNAN